MKNVIYAPGIMDVIHMGSKLFADKLDRRDKLQLLADIIKVTTRETKITRILRLANIQYNTFKECIETLCGAGLLRKVTLHDRPRRPKDMRTKFAYKATEIGMKWCEMVDEIYQMLKEPR